MRARDLASLLPLAILPACATQLPLRWTDPQLGFSVHTDFAPHHAEALFDADAVRKIAALCAVFEVTSLQGLHIYVHDEAAVPRGGDAALFGWQQTDEVHVLARWADGSLALPSIDTADHLGHELVHALHRRAGLTPPRWLEEGLCEVLAASPVAADGQLVLMPNAQRERVLRSLRADGRWLGAPQLLECRSEYPADPQALGSMYLQGTSLAWFLVGDGTPLTLARLRTLAAMPDAWFAERFAAWEPTLADTTVTSMLAPFANHPDAQVRGAVAADLGSPAADPAWWQIATALLADPDAGIRATARIQAIHQPPTDVVSRTHLEALRDADDPNLHFAGLAGLAKCGSADALLQFATTVPPATGSEWWQTMLWMAMLVPGDGQPRAFPDYERSAAEADYLRDYGRALAADFERLRPRLAWHEQQRRWRLR